MVSFVCYLLLLSLSISFSSCSKTPKQKELPPTVVHASVLSDGWYSQDKNRLSAELDQYLTIAKTYFPVADGSKGIKALIVPHAGMYYSGLCASTAYQTLLSSSSGAPTQDQKNKQIKRVIILSPCHTMFLHGVALPDYTVYRTVLGEIPVDYEAVNKLRKHHLFKATSDAHVKEHAIEIQLPFLQKTVSDFSIVPLIVGNLKDEDPLLIAKELEKIIDEHTLLVVSSDFTHHGTNYDYRIFTRNISAQLRFLDSLAVRAILAQSYGNFSDVLLQTDATICGRDSIKVLLALLKLDILPETVGRLGCYYTSSHMAQAIANGGELVINKLFDDVPDQLMSSSVSYAAMVFAEQDSQEPLDRKDSLTGYEKRVLLNLARRTIENSFASEDKKTPEHLLKPLITPALEQPSGTFVTLETRDHNLRGCIGRIISKDSLYQTIGSMALSAAFHDNRFKPLKSQELEDVIIEISILSLPTTVSSYKDIVIGKHGVVLSKRDQNGNVVASSVFLPHVAPGFGWDVVKTLEQLSIKAGLDKDAWRANCTFDVFEAFQIKEDF